MDLPPVDLFEWLLEGLKKRGYADKVIGVAKYIYHRPAHGEGMEGHQAPWLALGDYTVLEEGMTFSVEPGLYDPESGFGYNPSDNLLVTEKKGVLMSSVPYSKEWMFLKL